MKIIINGAGGRMGNVLASLIEETEGKNIAALVSTEYQSDTANNMYANINEYTGNADMIIDFSNHSATSELCQYAVSKGIPLIIATTGQTEEEMETIMEASREIPVFKSGNMSLGIALLGALAKQIAKTFPDADIEIIEKHHNKKLDVPSGTALLLADNIKEVKTDADYNIGRNKNGERRSEEIGIHSVRMGSEVGTHEIIFATGNQVITVTHNAENRGLFADGALSAADFLMGKPAGLYDMQNVVKEGQNKWMQEK